MSYTVPQLKTVNVTRYVLPLREGGSLPGLVEASDGHNYVIKFRGAAQGPKVLIAELIGGEIARALGLNMPELVFANFDEAFGRTESDKELQDQFKASVGLNIALRHLSGSNMFDPNITKVDHIVASSIVWLDGLLMNMDRTVRNTNLLVCNKELWLIDNGASLYFHYNWFTEPKLQALKPFPFIKDHVLLPKASRLKKVNTDNRALLTASVIESIVSQIPDEWITIEPPFASADACREAYRQFLVTRIAKSDIFVKEAQHAREQII